jgi:hypothetical protein
MMPAARSQRAGTVVHPTPMVQGKEAATMSQATPSPFDIEDHLDLPAFDTVHRRVSAVLEPERVCEECGYDLRGLPAGNRCSECGHVNVGLWQSSATREVAWTRSVAIGLALLVGVTLYAVSSVLVQPFADEPGGTLSAMNLPGPKLWAVPLLQRPIGQSPELPG